MTTRFNSTQILFWDWILGLNRLQRSSLLVWVLVTISIPIQIWVFDVDILPVSVTINVLVQVTVVLVILKENWNWRKLLTTAAAVSVMAWLVEYLGKTTGFPFASYTYTGRLQPQLLGVPLLIPLAWLMMLPPSWAIGKIITVRLTSGKMYWLIFGTVSGMAMTAWDFFLDPQMVNWGFWVWDRPSGFFGIPWANYAGWLIVSTLITWIIRPNNLPVYPLILIYSATMFLQAFGESAFWSLPGLALAGLLAIGFLVVLAITILGNQEDRK